jgi:peptidoglycan/LPS O-acetylase OafA/YrhL
MPYRADIDGLRALAVWAVVLFHFDVAWCPGGFVGVDIFFVISGYLITRLILAQIAAGRFSILTFYHWRILRLLPALTLVVLAVLLLGWVLLLPGDLQQLGLGTGYVAVFLSNVHFWTQTGYFAPAAEQSILLHTWSLAVEEQFYIAWPLLLLVFTRLSGRGLACLIAALLLASLALDEWLVRRGDYAAAFYLSPSRAWELMLGALLACGALPPVRRPVANTVLSYLGMMLILGTLLLFHRGMPFPGLNALAACLGTALVIHAGVDDRPTVNGLLGTRPLVFIGLVSYPFYLWHWPLAACFKYTLMRAPDAMESALLIALALTLAVLSWKFVEQPVRYRYRARGYRRGVILGGTLATLTTLALGGAVYALDGFPSRLGDAFPEPARYAMLDPAARHCLTYPDDAWPGEACLFGAEGAAGPLSAVLWGDSHAAHYLPAVAPAVTGRGWTLRQMTRAACAPYAVSAPRTLGDARCLAFNRRVLESVLADARVELVILAAMWSSHAGDLEFVAQTVAQLVAAGKRVLLMGQVPQAGFPPLRCFALQQWRPWMNAACTIPRDGAIAALQQQQHLYLSKVAGRHAGVVFFNPFERLCDARSCRTADGHAPFYFDEHHLNPHGAQYLAGRVERMVEASLSGVGRR